MAPDKTRYPDDAKQRTLIEQWSYWQAIHLGPAMQKLTLERVFKEKFNMGKPDEDAVAQHPKDIAQFLPLLNASLRDKDCVVRELSIADFAMACAFISLDVADISLADAPDVAAWIKRLQDLPSSQKAVAPLLAMMG